MKLREIAASVLLATTSVVNAVELNIDDEESIKSAASTIAYEMVSYYYGNTTEGIPGLLGDPYYWWEAGAMFGALIDYWYYTGDDTYNEITTQAMLHQTGPQDNFEPPNQTKSLGNDDQAFWAMAAMSAAEQKYPNPPDDEPQWLALVQAVFNRQAARWDETSCGGGLKWQIFTFNNGYNYKNSISNGAFFNMAARLGFYTKNETYLEWATRSWEWSKAVGLISPQYFVFDGTDDNLNCSQLNHVQWSYNAGVHLLGAAVMWNMTADDEAVQSQWEERVRGLLQASGVFFKDGVMYEVACEPQMNCNTDQQSFKAYLSRWMAASTKYAPWVYDLVTPNLEKSAMAAAQSCSGGETGVTCGTRWTYDGWDNTWGVGQQMNALEVIQGMLIQKASGPVSNDTGGISRGDPNAGTDDGGAGGGGGGGPGQRPDQITTGDQAGAGILTAVILIGLLGGAWWMIA